jgi:hypothetical protein
VQAVERLLPQAAVDEVVPLRDEVVDRAAAEAMPLISLPVWQNGTPQSMQRAPCWRSFFSSMWWWNSFQSRRARRRAVDRQFAQVFDEAGWFAHGEVRRSR